MPTKPQEPKDDYTLIVVSETTKAYGCKEKKGADTFWLPKSQVDMDARVQGEINGKPIHTFTVPNWLAEKVGIA